MRRDESVLRSLRWLEEAGLNDSDLEALVSCVPGEFTLAEAYYVNTGSRGIIYHGSEEGTLPLLAGRWYMLSEGTMKRHPDLSENAVPVAEAVGRVG